MRETITRSIKDFTSSATCKHYNAISVVDVEMVKGQSYDRAVAHKDILKGVLSGDFELDELKDLVSQGIESNYALDATNEKMEDKEVENLARYLRCEKRKPIFHKRREVEVAEGVVIDDKKPDAIFLDKSHNEIEVVIWRSGSPTINQRTGMKPEKTDNMKEWFQLWVLTKYAFDYATKENPFNLQSGDLFRVKASFYFMKKTTDGKTVKDMDFFSGNGGNIVSLIEDYTFGVKPLPNDTDKMFMKFMDECDAGLSCTDADCKKCTGYAICHYTKAPVTAEKKQVKKRSKITLSAAQQAIVDAVKGCYKVNATAGSGKTECMTERSKRLIANGCNPHDILHISFTNVAVGEMKERIAGKCLAEGIAVSGDDIECYTFNGFANNAIGEYFQELGFTKAPKPLSDEFNLDLIEKLIDSTTLSDVDMGAVTYDDNGIAIPRVITNVARVFETIKKKMIDVDDADAINVLHEELSDIGVMKSMTDRTLSELIDLYKEYNARLVQENLVTYSDQEPLMFKVLEMHPEYFERLGYRHIVVDEFQDSNEVQVETIKRLTDTSSFESLMVVGDDSQAIYAFRDTTPEYIINFEKYLGKPVTNLMLTENRRSTPEIIKLANDINNLNVNKIDKDMIATRESGATPLVRGFHSEKEELSWIVEQIERKINEGEKPENIAFIGSKRTELAKVGSKLSEKGIPWVMKSPMNLMENSRILGAMSLADAFYQPEATILYLSYLVAKYDGEILNIKSPAEINAEIAMMKSQFENIWKKDMEEQKRIFHQYLEEIKNVTKDELYEYFLSLLYDNEDLPSELEYTRIFKKYGSKMGKKMDQNYEGVVLTTVHSSKGLEWPVCFLSVSNFDSERLHMKRHLDEIEEKRRLLFVAITRARDELYCTGQYVAYGPKDDRTYNQFLREVFNVLGESYNPIDPMEAIREREAKERARERAKERYAAKKAGANIQAVANSLKSSTKSSKGKSRELTEDEKREYNKLVANAQQIKLPF